MKTMPRSFAMIAACSLLGCLVAEAGTVSGQQYAQASPNHRNGSQPIRFGRPGGGPPLRMPRGLPEGIHLPSAGYTIEAINENIGMGLQSGQPVPAVFAQFESTMKSAGWTEKSERQGQMGSALEFSKGARELDIDMDNRMRESGTVINLRLHCRLRAGDVGSCDDLAADLPASADFQVHMPQNQNFNLQVQTRSVQEALFEEYDAAMPAAGWRKTEESKSLLESEQRFERDHLRVRVHLVSPHSDPQEIAHLEMDVTTN